MKASSVALLTQCRRVCTAKGPVDLDIPETTPLPDDHRDIYPLALWNACATSPISISADAIMCNQGSPPRRRSVVDDEEEQEDAGSRSGGEESSLWSSGKQNQAISFRLISRWLFIAMRSTNAGFSGSSSSSIEGGCHQTEVDGKKKKRGDG
jgi:hypothetical protein